MGSNKLPCIFSKSWVISRCPSSGAHQIPKTWCPFRPGSDGIVEPNTVVIELLEVDTSKLDQGLVVVNMIFHLVVLHTCQNDYLSTHIYIYIYMSICIYVSLYSITCLYICIYIYVYIYVSLYSITCLYICIYIYTCIYIYIYVYIIIYVLWANKIWNRSISIYIMDNIGITSVVAKEAQLRQTESCWKWLPSYIFPHERH